jgi:drug/metabolite transporter (DMT)-like permease
MRLAFLLGVGLAALSAAASQLGFLFRHRGAVAAPDVDARHPLRSAIGLFRSKWWTIGYGVAAVAYLLHVGALGLAPLSLVQAVLASGLVMLGVLAERFFGFHLGRREWAGIGLAGAGLAVLAVTGETGGKESADYSVPAMIAFEGVLVGVGAALILSRRARRARDRWAVLLGVAAGLLFTVTHVAVKAMSATVDSGLAQAWISPYLPLVVVCAVVAFFASARSLQIGQAVPVIAMTSIAGNASAIPAGIIVFGDPLGSDALEIGVRSLAFAMVVTSAALIPAPVRAAGKARAAGVRARQEESAQPV